MARTAIGIVGQLGASHTLTLEQLTRLSLNLALSQGDSASNRSIGIMGPQINTILIRVAWANRSPL